MTTSKEQTKIPYLGPFLFILVGFLVLIVALLFMLSSTPEVKNNTDAENLRPTAAENNEPESTTAEAAVETIQTLSPSTELSSIEGDLEATIINDLTHEFNAIEAELSVYNDLEVQ